ncbi:MULTISPECIES: 4-oxalocrotonate tautomerase DmpI [unclassified Desulfovibrio]|uniref:4-oxalocrotonate tautomerase DmpI n=1 Tax=unclassified Desulfovibrio TaxID=2593640 RepID=UPI000F6002E8|nr:MULTISPECIES: 4-oxalocrotonate tautomerase DmpI [unclassified Desulfovibrio]RRD69243.1 4-oxalocrotonate tautomerase [Desulfovibrio sp. OH1209_COT-279]RRD85709.1 4-oxalocrotonate tautomerase [Desulfovibrio sp. OH1186_COT-070]
MPVITLEAASLDKEQKEQLIAEFTESAARIMNMPKESFYVFLKENILENIGVGGEL